MRIIPKRFRKFQEGGDMQAPEQGAEEAPEQGAEEAPEQGGEEQGGNEDPIAMLAKMSQQALQEQNCEMAMQVCQAFLQIAQQAGGGSQAPQEEPVYRRGGILVGKIRK